MAVVNEQETWSKIFILARAQGCLPEARTVYQKYDRLLKRCTSQKEFDEIATLGIAEMHKLLNVQGGLSIDGKEILPANPNMPEDAI